MAKTVSRYLCDVCDHEITKPENGFVIHGNIYVADPKCYGGLIGNNFPKEKTFSAEQIERIVLCKTCFCKALGIDKKISQKINPTRHPRRWNGGITRTVPDYVR